MGSHLAVGVLHREGEVCAAHLPAMDSSHLNEEGGSKGSWGGYAMGYEGSGLMDWRSFNPRKLSDSTGGSELIQGAAAMKALLGWRILFRGLRQAQEPPSELFVDASATIAGSDPELEKVPREMKYMAVRYAMLREAQNVGAARLVKVHTTVNPSDLMTKPIVGKQFEFLRGIVMGEWRWSRADQAPID